MADKWIAEVETRNSQSRGFGSTPEEAVRALLRRWREDYAPRSGADPDYLGEIREEITICEFEFGGGYVLGGDDHSWHESAMTADHPSLNHVFDEPPAPKL